MTDVAPDATNEKLVSIEDEMKRSYLEYAMSVIVSRALPDVRDGMKPVHRRILYAMKEGDYTRSKPYKKSARVVGDVMGKFHPHGDSAIYDAMVRMAQDFSLRLPLIDGQGNFGSIDGDPPAAMRYTEARMASAAHEMTEDLVVEGDMEKGNQGWTLRKGRADTVDFEDNYDESTIEPSVLPARIPNLLINGSEGIAVGMATKIPTHNPAEAITACLMYLDNPGVTLAEVMEVMPGPDFPTGGVIMGRSGIRDAYETGRGSLTISGVTEVKEIKKGRTAIVVTEFPYMVNKAKFLERVAELVNGKTIEGVADLRDESDRDGISVVIELKRDADPNLVLNKLRKDTALVTSYGVNAVCLDSKGNPRTMGLLQIIGEFVAFRRDVVRRRTVYRLDRARNELYRQIGLFAATSMIDEVVRTIRQSPDPDTARVRLMEMEFPTVGEFGALLMDADPDLEELPPVFRLSDVQVRAIMALSLRSLTGLEQDKIANKARELSAEIHGYVRILRDPAVRDDVVRRELAEARERYKTERRTRIESNELDALSEDDLVQRKDVVLTMSRSGYIKYSLLDAYREQNRGGKGKTGMDTKDDDFVALTLACSTKTPLLFFTSRGIAHALKTYRLPETAPNNKGKPLVNYLPLRTNEGETIATVMPLPEDSGELDGKSMVFVTDFGDIRRNDATDFADIRKTGKIAIRLDDENGNPTGRLVAVLLCSPEDNVLLATRKGKSIRFRVDELRTMQSRTSSGVRGIALGEDDAVISATVLKHTDYTPDERQAYLAGGVASVTERVRLADHGPIVPHRKEQTPFGAVEVFEAPAESPDEVAIRRVVTLAADHKARMAADEQFLLTVSELGYGKRSSGYDYRITGRGGKGVDCMNINKVTGDLVACMLVNDADGLVMVTDGGQMIRTRVADIKVQGRTTRGVTLFKVGDDQRIADVTRIEAQDAQEAE